MYYLPLFINHRRYHYCTLHPESTPEGSTPAHFIVEHHPGFQPILVSIHRDTEFLSGKGTENDLPLGSRNLRPLTTWDSDKNRLEVVWQEGDAPRSKTLDAFNQGLDQAPFQWESAGDRWLLRYLGDNRLRELQLRVGLDQDGLSLRDEVVLHLGDHDDLFDGVFDFGSEASQMAYKQRSQEAVRDQRIHMLDRLLFDFYGPALADGRLQRVAVADQEGRLTPWNVDYGRYYQYDPSDEKLFRSSFMVRRSHEKADPAPHLQEAPFERGTDEWVSILGDTYDPRLFDLRHPDSYQLIPNLKLAELGYIRDFKLQLGPRLAHFSDAGVRQTVFRRLMNEFLHLLLAEIESAHPENRRKLLRLSLLVPNIYSQGRIHRLLADLQEDFARIRERYGYGFAGLEVQTLSESDGSFLGLLSDPSVEGVRMHDLRPDDHYLVIDIGKGTTDFSVLSMGEERGQFSSVFRSGFAGGGNALTYAFLETLAGIVAGTGEREARAVWIEGILGAEIQQKVELLRWVEQLKHRYSDDTAGRYSLDEMQAIPNFANRPLLSLRDLNEVLEYQFVRKRKTLEDHFGFVRQTIGEIVSRTLTLVERSGVRKFAGVVLSGRGFLLEELRTAMEEGLRAQFEVGDVFLEDKKLKTSCLYGPLNFPSGTNKNSDLVGTPVITERSGLPSLRGLFSRHKERPRERTWSEADLHGESFFLQGQTMDMAQQRITVSGRELLLPGNLVDGEDGEVNLLYTGQGFLARTRVASVPLQFGQGGHDNPLADPLAWKSLFPHVTGPVPVSPELEPVKERPTVRTEATSANTNPTWKTFSISPGEPREVEPPATENQQDLPPEKDDMWDYL